MVKIYIFYLLKNIGRAYFHAFFSQGSLKKWMDLVHNWGGGGGVQAESTFHVFFTNNVKIMSKNGKRMMKQW